MAFGGLGGGGLCAKEFEMGDVEVSEFNGGIVQAI